MAYPDKDLIKKRQRFAKQIREQQRKGNLGSETEKDEEGFSDDMAQSLYGRGDTLGLDKEGMDAFIAKNPYEYGGANDFGPEGRKATEYGTVGDGSYYSKRDEAARDRNSALAGQRGATKTSGLDRQAAMQGTPLGSASSLGSGSNRPLESDLGRAFRLARRAKRAGLDSSAERVVSGALGKEMNYRTPGIKTETYREQEAANRRKLAEDMREREKMQRDVMDYYSSFIRKRKEGLLNQ